MEEKWGNQRWGRSVNGGSEEKRKERESGEGGVATLGERRKMASFYTFPNF